MKRWLALHERKPVVGVTMGDACGIGPEIILKAWEREEVFEFCIPW